MKIYRTYLKMIRFRGANTEDEQNDFWSNKEDALSYVEHVSQNNRCTRAELWELYTEEGFSLFKEDDCLFEYDVNGVYLWTK